jgi:enoyl-CoA hydratase/carnithine racemase
MEATQQPLLFRRDGHVALLTLNRPHRLNAIDGATKEALAAAWTEIGEDPTIRAVVLTGAGEKAFCVGADVKDMAEGDRALTARLPYPPAILTARHAGIYKPVVTAVNGICAGGGLHFVADGDIVIASERATFVDPHVHVGQVAALEPIGLVRRIGLGATLRMVLLGRAETLSATEALDLGLVSEVHAPEVLLDRAFELADIVASGSPAAVQASLRAVWESLECGLDVGLRRGWEIVMDHWAHPDASEGPRAFAQKRPPQWDDSV